MVTIRKSTLADLPEIEKIYEHGRQIMIENNNPHQWRDCEPEISKILKDIDEGNHYIIKKNHVICGVFAMIFGEDPTYKHIDGNWLNNDDYITIHRIATSGVIKGIFDLAISYAFEHCNNVRIDTHNDNSIMRHLLEKHGFTYCGIIRLANSEPRLAFQKCNM